MYCPNCYRMIPDDSQFCSNCGTDTSFRVCINCGSHILPGEKTCRQCGIPVNGYKQPPKRTVDWVWGANESTSGEIKTKSTKKMDMKRAFVITISILVFCYFLFPFTETSPSSNSTSDSSPGAESYQTKDSSVGVEVYHGNGVRISADDISYDKDSAQISLLVENSNNESVGVYCNTFIVNGATIPGSMWVDVAANAKAKSAIYIDSHELYLTGIDNIVSVLSYDAHISFPDSARETAYITFGAKTGDADDYIQYFDYTGDVLYNQNGITVISKFQPGQKTRKIPIMIENNSGRDFRVWTNNVTANGYTIPEWHGNTIVCDDTVRYLEVELDKWSMEESNVEYINTASMTIDFMEPKATYVLWETGTLNFT